MIVPAMASLSMEAGTSPPLTRAIGVKEETAGFHPAGLDAGLEIPAFWVFVFLPPTPGHLPSGKLHKEDLSIMPKPSFRGNCAPPFLPFSGA
jgi:hypothetical protein